MSNLFLFYNPLKKENRTVSEDLICPKCFTKEIRRVTLKDHPLAPGSIAVCFTEDKKGKPISSHIREMLQSTNIADIQTRNDILGLKYWINVEITSPTDENDLQDLRIALRDLDKASIDYRVSIATDDNQQIKESARRSSVNLHINGAFNLAADYPQEFDTCVLDTSNVDIATVEKNLITVAAVAQRDQPTVWIISTELANKLMDKDFKNTGLGKVYNSKIVFKSVFAPSQTGDVKLENPFVREILV